MKKFAKLRFIEDEDSDEEVKIPLELPLTKKPSQIIRHDSILSVVNEEQSN